MLKPICRHFFLAIETDATRYHGSNARRPGLLDDNQAQQLLAHISADLAGMLPAFSQCELALAGALFDQTQILRPGYPALAALEQLLGSGSSDADANRISLGASNGKIETPGLQPEGDIPLGILQLLPVVVRALPDVITELGTDMEHRFLEEGQVSAHTARWLEPAFNVKINHARFMTLMDLNAMFRLQLEHFGFLPLWQLIDAALNGMDKLDISLETGQQFIWREDSVHTEFQSFDYWSTQGAGMQMDSYRGRLAGGYAEWTRLMRQYLAMLTAHRVNLTFTLPVAAADKLDGSYFVEPSGTKIRSRSAEVTEHSFAELGTICVSVLADRRQDNYYPLRPEGLNDIHDAIRELGLGGRTISYPGTILFDEKDRCLVADRL